MARVNEKLAVACGTLSEALIPVSPAPVLSESSTMATAIPTAPTLRRRSTRVGGRGDDETSQHL
jgi:hypothetical protein